MMLNRDDQWLLSRLDFLWSTYFSDLKQMNPVFINFGRFARLRFGSIRYDRHQNKTHITITGMFKDISIPEEVVDHTIAHELCHYLHGFSSPYPKQHKFPHEGGVIKKELYQRGLEYLYQSYSKWIKSYRKQLRKTYSVRRLAW